jgi:hypothetical protein
MLVKILIGVAVLLVILVIVVATRPAAFRIERSIRISAPPASAFALVNDFHRWGAWSPWEKMDPNLERVYEGANSGKGSIYSWKGNNKVGEGRMTIEQTQENSKIVIKLEFFRPFKATNTATFTFTPEGDGTKVNWAMDGCNGFVAKGFHMVMDMDKLVGADFERGLAAMKDQAERDHSAVARN